jgi:two-component system OmpR family sensor kinase
LIFFKRLWKDKDPSSVGCHAIGEMIKDRFDAGVGFREGNNHLKKDAPMGRERIKIDLLIHDLKVPMAVIEAGISAMLNRQDKYGPLTEKQEKVLLRALRNVKVTQTLVNDALELGRSGQGMVCSNHFKISYLIEQALIEIFDLTDANASEGIKQCSSLKDLKASLQENGLLMHVEESLWCQEVCLDEAKVRQILRNLLSNALKYRKRKVELEVDYKNNFLFLSVKDDGEGIPAQYHKKIFESYFQMDPSVTCTVRGHGLGLAGVMVLVEDLGGQLSLESDEGRGAKFSVRVPTVSE